MLLVASDLHLGAGASLGRLPDQESSWKRFCTAAAEHGATVLWAGDSHHHKRPSPAEIDAWQSGLRILREGGCTLLGIPGNHCISTVDAPSTIEVASAGFDCHILRAADIVETEDGPVGLLPWAPYSDARQMAGSLMVLAEALAERGARVLIGHWALAGSHLPSGLSTLELAEPLLDPHRLAELFEITLFGHIHKRQEIVAEPLVAHIGPLCRGNFGEADVWTGGWQIVPEDGALTALPFDVPDRAFASISFDVRGMSDPTGGLLHEIARRFWGGAIVKLGYRITADQVVDQAAVLAALDEARAWRVTTLEPIVERAQSTRSAGVTEASDPREAWDTWQAAQDGIASDETQATVRERAHERIGAA